MDSQYERIPLVGAGELESLPPHYASLASAPNQPAMGMSPPPMMLAPPPAYGQMQGGPMRPAALQMLRPDDSAMFMQMRKLEGGAQLQKIVEGVANDLVSSGRYVQGPRVADMSMKQLLEGFMMPEERVISYNPIPFSNVAIHYLSADCTRVESKVLFPSGYLLQTDRRVLLLSNRHSESVAFAKTGNPMQLRGNFEVKYSAEDSFWYQPVPLKAVKSATVLATSVIQSNQRIGVSSCIFCCTCCVNWFSQPQETTAERTREIKLGVRLPPWEVPCDLIIQLEAQVPLEVIQEFVSMLQNLAHLY